MPAIPDRWIPYKACGNVIEGTRFICFKVPLKRSVQTGVREIKEIWDVPALLSKIPNLGAVIDLTNTARYYKPAELLAAGVLHKKILMPGRIIPPKNKVTEFMNAVDEFLGKEGDFLIGIHCTHGLNRTGYMVCRYMRDRLGVPAKDAIKRFEKARGYQIERQNYIADLLGKPPHEADVGSHTAIKPVSNENSRSSLTDEDDIGHEQSNQRDRFSRNNNTSNSRYNTRYFSNRSYDTTHYNWREPSTDQTNWRHRENNQRRDSARSGDSSKSDYSTRSNGSSYDYRYDY